MIHLQFAAGGNESKPTSALGGFIDDLNSQLPFEIYRILERKAMSNLSIV